MSDLPPPPPPPPPPFPPPSPPPPSPPPPPPPTSGGRSGSLIAVAAAAVLLVAVVGVVAARLLTGGGPDAAARRFLEASADNDVEATCELLSPERQKSFFEGADDSEVDDCASFAESITPNDELRDRPIDELDEDSSCQLTTAELEESFARDVEITDTREDGDRATVGYRITTRFTGSDDELRDCGEGVEKESTITSELGLRRIDGDWLIDDTGERGG